MVSLQYVTTILLFAGAGAPRGGRERRWAGRRMEVEEDGRSGRGGVVRNNIFVNCCVASDSCVGPPL